MVGVGGATVCGGEAPVLAAAFAARASCATFAARACSTTESATPEGRPPWGEWPGAAERPGDEEDGTASGLVMG